MTQAQLEQQRIAAEDMIERLDRTTPEVVNEVHDVAWKLLSAQESLEARIDSRAGLLFTAVGFSMTLAFSFGGWALIDKANQIPLGAWIAVAFVIVLALGLVTSGFAIAALLVRKNYRWIDESEVWNTKVVAAGKTQQDYRIHMATHVWQVWQARHVRTEQKAGYVARSQYCLAAFLAGILFLSVLAARSAIIRPRDAPTAAQVTCNVVSGAGPTASPTPAVVASPPSAYDSADQVGTMTDGKQNSGTKDPKVPPPPPTRPMRPVPSPGKNVTGGKKGGKR